MARLLHHRISRQDPPYQTLEMNSNIPPPSVASHVSPMPNPSSSFDLNPNFQPASDGDLSAELAAAFQTPDAEQAWDELSNFENYEWSPTPEQMAQFDLEFETATASQVPPPPNFETDPAAISSMAQPNFFNSNLADSHYGLSQPAIPADSSFGSEAFLEQDEGEDEFGGLEEQRLEQAEGQEESDEEVDENEGTDEEIDQLVWDPSIANPSQAQAFLLSQAPGRKVVKIPDDDISVQRQNLTQFAQTLFSAMPQPPPKAKLEWGDKGPYYDGYQEKGLLAVKKLLGTENGRRIAQSQAIVVVANAADLHGPGLVTTAKGLTMDCKLKFSERIQCMIDCLRIKHIARKLIEGDEAAMAQLVLNPKGLLKTRETAAKNNAGKHKTFRIGKDALASQEGSTDGNPVAKSTASSRKPASSFKNPLSSQHSMAQLSNSFTDLQGSATSAGARNPTNKRRRETAESPMVRPTKRIAGRFASSEEPQTTRNSSMQSFNAPGKMGQSSIPGFGPDSYGSRGSGQPEMAPRFSNPLPGQLQHTQYHDQQSGFRMSRQSPPSSHQSQHGADVLANPSGAYQMLHQNAPASQNLQASVQAFDWEGYQLPRPGASRNANEMLPTTTYQSFAPTHSRKPNDTANDGGT